MNVIHKSISGHNLPDVQFPEWAAQAMMRWGIDLNLHDWDIHLKMDSQEQGDGVAYPDSRYKVATISISSSLMQNGNDHYFKMIAIHELMEIVLADLVYTIRERIVGDFIKDETIKEHTMELFTDNKERMIQLLTRTLVAHYEAQGQ